MAVDRLMHDIAQLEYTLFVVNTYAAGELKVLAKTF